MTREDLARFDWPDGSAIRRTVACLIDVSRAGAGFVAADPPPIGQAMRIRQEAPRMAGRVSAHVVRLEGQHEGGLAFSDHRVVDLIRRLN